MHKVPIKDSLHDWEKKNLITLSDKKGCYDAVECRACGIHGKRYQMDTVSVDGRYSETSAFTCQEAKPFVIPTKVRVTTCNAVGKQFGNLTPHSEHEVISPPGNYQNDRSGIWVMGVGEPVKLLSSEYTVIS